MRTKTDVEIKQLIQDQIIKNLKKFETSNKNMRNNRLQ